LLNKSREATLQGRRWTPEMDGFLQRMHARGKSLAWIARTLAVPRVDCAARALTLGVIERRPRATRDLPPLPEPKPIGPPNDVVDEGACHWVAGCLDSRHWRMCGHRAVQGTSWCAHHLARVRPSAPASAPQAEPARVVDH
jgi:hypothetical protein